MQMWNRCSKIKSFCSAAQPWWAISRLHTVSFLSPFFSFFCLARIQIQVIKCTVMFIQTLLLTTKQSFFNMSHHLALHSHSLKPIIWQGVKLMLVGMKYSSVSNWRTSEKERGRERKLSEWVSEWWVAEPEGGQSRAAREGGKMEE